MGDGRTRARGRHRRGIQGKGTEGRGRRDRLQGLNRGPFIPDHLFSTEHGTPRPTDTPISTRRQSSTMPSSSIWEAFSSPVILFHPLRDFPRLDGRHFDGSMERNKAFQGYMFHPHKSISASSTLSTDSTASREFNTHRGATASSIVDWIRFCERNRAASFHPQQSFFKTSDRRLATPDPSPAVPHSRPLPISPPSRPRRSTLPSLFAPDTLAGHNRQPPHKPRKHPQ